MIAAVVTLLVIVIVLVVIIVCYEREFRRVGCFLSDRDEGSNQRLTIDLRTRGVLHTAHGVNELLDDVEQARADTREGQQRIREELASLSHDVRTPLAGAQGYLQLYGVEDDLSEKDRCVHEANERLSAMKDLFDMMFEYAKASVADPDPKAETAVLFDAAFEAFASLLPDFMDKGWEPIFEFDDKEHEVNADRNDVLRIFSNLALNCLRHGAAAPSVVQCENEVVVTNKVEHPESIDADRMFERFYRGDSSRSEAGSGLGLAIVARLCERVGAEASASIEGEALSIKIRF